MPQLLEQKDYQQELKPLLVRSISTLIPSLTEVEVLRRQLMLDIQTLVESDESYRKLLITELSALDRSWSFINNKPGGNPDQKQIRIGLQIKLALLSVVQDYRRAQEIAAGLVDLAKASPELSKFVSDQLETSLASSPSTALRVITRSAIQSLNRGPFLPHSADEQRKGMPLVFIVVADESQQMEGEKLAQELRENGFGALAGKEPKLVDVSADHDPETVRGKGLIHRSRGSSLIQPKTSVKELPLLRVFRCVWISWPSIRVRTPLLTDR
jgi:hypothetical protein